MALSDTGKLRQSGSNFYISLHKPFVRDSNFPFDVGDTLKMTIEGKQLVIEKESTVNESDEKKGI